MGLSGPRLYASLARFYLRVRTCLHSGPGSLSSEELANQLLLTDFAYVIFLRQLYFRIQNIYLYTLIEAFRLVDGVKREFVDQSTPRVLIRNRGSKKSISRNDLGRFGEIFKRNQSKVDLLDGCHKAHNLLRKSFSLLIKIRNCVQEHFSKFHFEQYEI